ncbi:kinase-like protein [Dentipellis sp. KUC8613]|nr:kinase-like protein [Dentipellis sp. KUC8613]
MPSASDSIPKRFIGAVEDEWQLFSDRLTDYTRGDPIGFGASSSVYRALYKPPSSPNPPVPCALKVLDLDKLPPNSLRLLQRETQLMSLSKHPNVLRVRGSWMDGHKLYIAMRLMNAGSAADVMRYGWPGGMEEEVVRCLLKQALEGLNYLHINGFIHRDIKAANLLIDDDGTVLLGDLGVAAPLHDEDHSHSHESTKEQTRTERATTVYFQSSTSSAPRRARVGKRRSFVGTPCWMAPELIAGKHYDSSADIWSFGITALELAQGRAPRSRESPKAVLLQTVQDAPPTLDREGGVHKYSRAFKEIVEACLAKEPSKRPTAEQLLQTPFFKHAKRKSYLVGTILNGLPPLTQRLERLRQPSLLLHGTVDSWDFSTSIVPSASSPTSSLFRRSHRASVDGIDVLEEQPLEAAGGTDAVFEFDEVLEVGDKGPPDEQKHVEDVIIAPNGHERTPPSSLSPSPDPPPLSKTPETPPNPIVPPSETVLPALPLVSSAPQPIPMLSEKPRHALLVPSPSRSSSSRSPSPASAQGLSSSPVSPPVLAAVPSTSPSTGPRIWRKLRGVSISVGGESTGTSEKAPRRSLVGSVLTKGRSVRGLVS